MSSEPTPNPEATTPLEFSTIEPTELEKAIQERDRYVDMLQHLQAEFQNYQKRAAREREQERKFALFPLAFALLPVIDNLNRALKATTDPSPLSKGVEMVQTQLLGILKQNGIEPMDVVGKPFDPLAHEALMQQPALDQPAGTILQELEPGYMYFDRVLRPSKVIISSSDQ
jgi:molecular chaperone GrpE